MKNKTNVLVVTGASLCLLAMLIGCGGGGGGGEAAMDADESAPSTWSTVYPMGSLEDRGIGMFPTADGGFVVFSATRIAGSEAVKVVKIDSEGNDLSTHEVARNTQVSEVKATYDGAFVLVGSRPGMNDPSNVVVIKCNGNGQVEWDRTYPRDQNVAERGLTIAPTGSGYLVGGTVEWSDNYSSALLISISPNGDRQWDDAGAGDDTSTNAARFVRATNDGYIVGCTSTNNWNSMEAIYLYKLTLDRSFAGGVWYHFPGIWREVLISGHETADGGAILAGTIVHDVPFQSQALALKIDSNLNIEWELSHAAASTTVANSAIPTYDGGYLLTGTADQDALLVKLAHDGSVLWSQTYGGSQTDVARVALDLGSHIMVAGESNSFGPNGLDVWVFKVFSNGQF